MKQFIHKNKYMILLIVVFIIGTIIAYFYTYTPSYSSLESAIKITSRDGKATAKMKFDNGYFVFFKNAPMKYDYFYVKDKKWYNKGMISEKNYNIENRYQVTIYYVQRNKLSFIQVQDKNKNTKRLKGLKDSFDSKFVELSTSKNNSFYFAGCYELIPDEYTLTINQREYLLKEYNQLFKLFQ